MADSLPPPPPLPPSLTAPDMPPTEPVAFSFAALLLRVTDNGGVGVDVVCGYNYGHSREEAQAEFVAMVRQTYVGHSITKVVGAEVLPLEIRAEPVAEPPTAA